MNTIPLLSLKKQQEKIGNDLRQAVVNVIDSGVFIMGPQVKEFEAEFAKTLGAGFAIGVSSGTDALRIALDAAGVGQGDEVIVPSFTFIATATAVSALGAVPCFADIDEKTMTMSPQSVRSLITKKTKALIPVHLFGQPADMDSLMAIAKEHGLKVIEDCAQSHLTTYKGKVVGTIGDFGAFSFYPSKNLGAAGDAGAVVTNSPASAEACRQLRNCGRETGGAAYKHIRVGQNSRLDEMQAAILRVKLKHLPEWTQQRRSVAALYRENLKDLPLTLPCPGHEGNSHSFHLYVLRAPNRDALAQHLKQEGIGTAVYYPIPIHQQPAYQNCAKNVSLPNTEAAVKTALALPMYPELDKDEVLAVCRSIRAFFKK